MFVYMFFFIVLPKFHCVFWQWYIFLNLPNKVYVI